MKKLIVALLLTVAHTAYPQNQDAAISQINQDVWVPFIEALGNADIEAYLAVHHPSAIRISLDRNGIFQQGEAYFGQLRSLFGKIKQSEGQQQIQFRFSERIFSDKVASEKGYYKYVYEAKSTAASPYAAKIIYGSFHVISQKDENGRWKILLDFDYTNQEQKYNVTEKEFLTAMPL